MRASSHSSRETIAWFMVSLLWLSVRCAPTAAGSELQPGRQVEQAHQHVHRGHAVDRQDARTRGAQRHRRRIVRRDPRHEREGRRGREGEPAGRAARLPGPCACLGLLLRTLALSGSRSIVAVPGRGRAGDVGRGGCRVGVTSVTGFRSRRCTAVRSTADWAQGYRSWPARCAAPAGRKGKGRKGKERKGREGKERTCLTKLKEGAGKLSQSVPGIPGSCRASWRQKFFFVNPS